MRKIRKAAAVFAALCVAVSMQAFAEGKADQGAAKGPVTIRFIGGYRDYVPATTAIAADYMAANPNVKIEMVDAGTNLNEFFKVMLAGDQLVDIAHIPTTLVPSLVESKKLLPVTKRPVASRLLPFAKDPVTIGGEVYSIPLGVGAYGLVYNEDLFKAAGIKKVPVTRDELAAAAESLKRAGIVPFAPMLGEAWANGQYIEYVLAQVLNDNPGLADSILSGKAKLTDPVFAETTAYLDLIRKHVPSDAMNYKFSDGAAYFGAGKAAMAVHGDWIMPPALKANPALPARIAPIPWSNDPAKNKLILFGNFGFGILVSPATAKDPSRIAEIEKFFDYLHTPENIARIAAATGGPGGGTLAGTKFDKLHPIYSQPADYNAAGKVAGMAQFWKLPNAKTAAANTYVQGFMVGSNDAPRILSEIQNAIDLAR